MGRPVEGTALATVREKLQAIRIKGPPSMTGLGSNAVKPISYTPSTCDAGRLFQIAESASPRRSPPGAARPGTFDHSRCVFLVAHPHGRSRYHLVITYLTPFRTFIP